MALPENHYGPNDLPNLIPSLTRKEVSNWTQMGHLPNRGNRGRGAAGGHFFDDTDVRTITRIVQLVRDGFPPGIASRLAREGWSKRAKG